MRIIIAGSRSFDNYECLSDFCTMALSNQDKVEVVSGTASGADKLGERFAMENNYHLSRFPANWDKYGKSTGYKRNAEMAKYADALIAFWDGNSRGTKHMIDLAEKEGLKIKIVMFSPKN